MNVKTNQRRSDEFKVRAGWLSHVRLLGVTSPTHHFEGIVALSSELKVYRSVQDSIFILEKQVQTK